MFGNTSFTIKTACVALYLLSVNSVHSDEPGCEYPLTNYVMAEVQMSDGKVNYCLGSWICSQYTSTIANQNFSCRHVLTSASCIKSDENNHIRVFFKKDKFIRDVPLDELGVSDVISQTYYPTYDSTTHFSDIVLLKLETRFVQDKYISSLVSKSLQDIVNDIRNSRVSKSLDHILIITWDKYFMVKSKNILAYYEEDLVNCPSQGDQSSSIEGKYWFMFICVKESKYEPNIIGAKLAHCLEAGNAQVYYSILGYYIDSFELNGERISRYSLIHWYKPWIYSIMDIDNVHDLYDDSPDITDNITEIVPPIPVYSTEYYGDTAYDVVMGPNPWGNVAGVDGCFVRSDILLYAVIFNHLYIQFLIIM